MIHGPRLVLLVFSTCSVESSYLRRTLSLYVFCNLFVCLSLWLTDPVGPLQRDYSTDNVCLCFLPVSCPELVDSCKSTVLKLSYGGNIVLHCSKMEIPKLRERFFSPSSSNSQKDPSVTIFQRFVSLTTRRFPSLTKSNVVSILNQRLVNVTFTKKDMNYLCFIVGTIMVLMLMIFRRERLFGLPIEVHKYTRRRDRKVYSS